MLLPLTCLSFGLPVSPACLSVGQTSMDDSGHKENTATLEFKSSGCAVGSNLIYDSSLSLSVSVKQSKLQSCTPFLQGGGGCWASNQILKEEGLTGP